MKQHRLPDGRTVPLWFMWIAKAVIIGGVIAVVGGFLYAIRQGSRSIDARARSCEERGGIQVRTYGGFECIDARRLPP